MPYLLDTNCFYRVARNVENQAKLHAIIPAVATSILAPIEILNITSDAGNFQMRKDALRALTSIQTAILPDNPDNIVARAFGLPPRAGNIPITTMMRTMELAQTYEEAIQGVDDPQNHVRLTLHPEEIRTWKKNFSDFFTEGVLAGSRQVNDAFQNGLRKHYPGFKEDSIRKISRALTARSTHGDNSRNFAILGLSVRAGVFTEQEFLDAMNHKSLEPLLEKALHLYMGLLDSYLEMYSGLHERIALGHTPEKNAIFDLEFFTHLDANDTHFTFVTAEDLWIEIGEERLPNRVIHLDRITEN